MIVHASAQHYREAEARFEQLMALPPGTADTPEVEHALDVAVAYLDAVWYALRPEERDELNAEDHAREAP